MGTGTTAAKVTEAKAATRAGANELDMVAHTARIGEGMRELSEGKMPVSLLKYYKGHTAVDAPVETVGYCWRT